MSNSINVIYPEPIMESQPYFMPVEDMKHFAATFNRAAILAHGDNVEKVDLYLGVRTLRRVINDVVYDEGGWLEHHIQITYKSGNRFSVGAIQRKPDQTSEFHS